MNEWQNASWLPDAVRSDPMQSDAVRRAVANERCRAMWGAKGKRKVVLSKRHQNRTRSRSGITLCISIDILRASIHREDIQKRKQQQQYGSNQADGEEIDRRQSAPKAVGDESGAEIGAVDRRRQECAAIPTRNRGVEGDPAISEIDGAADAEAAVPAIGEGDCR